MNNLEKEILKVLIENHIQSNTSITAKSAASVAMKWIEKALSEAFNQAHYSQLHPDLVKRMEYNEWALKWLKESGLTPTEPDTKEHG